MFAPTPSYAMPVLSLEVNYFLKIESLSHHQLRNPSSDGQLRNIKKKLYIYIYIVILIRWQFIKGRIFLLALYSEKVVFKELSRMYQMKVCNDLLFQYSLSFTVQKLPVNAQLITWQFTFDSSFLDEINISHSFSILLNDVSVLQEYAS